MLRSHLHPVLSALCALWLFGHPGGQASFASDPIVTPETLTDRHVTLAIEAIVEELYSRRHPDRHWEPETPIAGESPQEGGHTALVALALLYAGESYQSPRLYDTIRYLATKDIDGTYAISVRTLIWARLPPRFRHLLEADTRWLIDNFSPAVGGWYYRGNPRTRRQDNSIAQYGALALWEASRRGVRVPSRIWQRIEEQFLAMQVEDGGWNYRGSGPSTGSMTTAGLATLFMTQDVLHAGAYTDIRRLPRNTPQQRAISLAMRWMDRQFDIETNPNNRLYYYYYLYNIERTGLAGGLRTFADQDWFRAGAAELINRFCAWEEGGDANAVAEESETGGRERFIVHGRVRGEERGSRIADRHLAFGLMFLSRGRVPIAINKVSDARPGTADPTTGGWNNRPRDVANFIEWVRQETVTEVNWQIVGFDLRPEEWLDAAMAYMAGHEPPMWYQDNSAAIEERARQARIFQSRLRRGEIPPDSEPPQVGDISTLAKMKRYLELGGMIVAVQEGSGTAFADAVEAAGTAMFPHYEWRTLDADHWAYTLLWPVRTARPPLRALSNGVRELIIVSPRTDFAASFQVRASDRQRNHYHTFGNLYLYASERKSLRPRIAPHAVTAIERDAIVADRFEDPPRRATVIRARHHTGDTGTPADWNAEPASLEVFSAAMRLERNLDIAIETKMLEEIDDFVDRVGGRSASPPSMVIVSGIGPATFTESQVDVIERYVNAGGIILFETTGGVGAAGGNFAEHAEEQLVARFGPPDGRPVRSTLQLPFVTGDNLPGAVPMHRVGYRGYSIERHGGREVTVRLRALHPPEANHEANAGMILFSREDLTHGLLDQPVWGVNGYAPDDARNLLGNIVQFAESRRRSN